ncbi:MAG: flavodoxin, partial [Spirochaetota bacterium]|nr:flavodoxin [Spirochaetota bacterium]
FLDRFRAQLENRPVAVFSLGPFHDDGKEWKEAREQLDKELAKYPWLKPVSIEMIGGRFDPANLRFPFSWIPALKRMEPVDIRDWKALSTWVKSLIRLISPPGGSDERL